MTEEQLKQLKTLLNIRFEFAKEQVEYYEEKGEVLEFLKYKNIGMVRAYESVLKDIERIMNK